MTTNPTAEDKATAAIKRRRAQGFLGRTDALEFILTRYRADLSEYLNTPTHPLHPAAQAAVEITFEVLKANARVADKARKVKAEMDRMIEYAEADASENIPLFGHTINVDQLAETATAVARVGAFLRSLDLAMTPFGRG